MDMATVPLEIPVLLLENSLLCLFTLLLLLMTLWLMMLLLSWVITVTLLPNLQKETAVRVARVLSFVVWMPVAKLYKQPAPGGCPVYLPSLQSPLIRFRPWLPLIRQLMFVLVVLGPKTMLTMCLGLACFCVRRLVFIQRILQRETTCTVVLGTLLYLFPQFSLLDVGLCLAYSVLNNVNVLTVLLARCRHWRLPWLRELPEDYLLRAVVVVDIVTWLLLLLQSFFQGQSLPCVASAINVLLGLLNVLGSSRWPLLAHSGTSIQHNAGQVIGVRRATRRELQLNNDLCPVCLRRMHSARVTSCGHFFHGHCLRKSMLISDACPVCRSAPRRSK